MKKFLLLISLSALSVVSSFTQSSLVTPAPPSASPKPESKSAHSSTTAPKAGIELPLEKKNPVHLPKFERAPIIDGKLDDEVWKSATVLKDFYQVQPGDNIAPSKPTEVFLGRDAKFIYIAF